MVLRLPGLLFAPALFVLAGWAGSAWAQAKLPRVGMLTISTEEVSRQLDAGFYRQLRRQGWEEGKNLAFVYASAYGDPSRYTEAAAELVRQRVDVIYADTAPAIRAAHAATRTIPIVGHDYTTDPVAAGYAKSYSRPGGNVTGVFLDAPEFSGKWLELLKTMLQGLSRVVVLWDPSPGDAHVQALRAIAPSFGVQLQVVEVRAPEDIDGAGSSFRGWPQALVILPSPMMYAESARLAKMAVRERLPATSIFREFAEQGGLLAYGPNNDLADERCGALVSSVLRGAKPGDLPIERPAKFEFVVNLKAAKALRLTIPDSVLLRADRVIR